MFTTHQLAQGFATIHRSYEVFQVFANSIVVPTPSFSVPQPFPQGRNGQVTDKRDTSYLHSPSQWSSGSTSSLSWGELSWRSHEFLIHVQPRMTCKHLRWYLRDLSSSGSKLGIKSPPNDAAYLMPRPDPVQSGSLEDLCGFHHKEGIVPGQLSFFLDLFCILFRGYYKHQPYINYGSINHLRL